ncbi:MAG TPA: hypothetical protein ENI59_00465, partial [Euryarchaeota archaeon]|nr:hypothetical protein [Euryarchaeota archaeon]
MSFRSTKFSKKTEAFIATLFLTILIIASVNILSTHTHSEPSQAYMPRFPSMLRLWQSIALEGKLLGKPEAYGKYVAYLYDSNGKPVLAVMDIIKGDTILTYPISLPSYLGTNFTVISSKITWFSWSHYGNDITGVALIVYTKDINGIQKSVIVSIPDIFGESTPFRVLHIPSSGIVKGLAIHETTLYVLESPELGRYSLRAIDLLNGETLWTFLNSEFVTPDWRLIESHYTRFISTGTEKDIWDLYENYAIIYKPLYEALSSLDHTIIYSHGKLFVALPFGPLLVVNATKGSLIKGDLEGLGWALSETPNEGIIREILFPVAIKYESSTGEDYIVTFSVLANYGEIIKNYINKEIGAPVGDLRGHLKVIVYSGSTGDVVNELDITNANATEISDTLKYSIATISPMTSFYVKNLSPAIFAQGLAYDYTWIFGTRSYIEGVEQNIEDKIASINPPNISEPDKPVMYLFTANQESIMRSFSKISLNSGDKVLKAYAFRALGYQIYYYLNDGNETYTQLNLREVILTIRESGMFAYGVSESQDVPSIAELNLIWAWEGYIPLDVVKISETVWGLVEEDKDSYFLRIVSPVYISAGSPSLGESDRTINALDMGFSFYDYVIGEWIPHLPRHLWGQVFYMMPDGELYSMGPNTTIPLTIPGMNTIRAIMLFNDTLEVSTDAISKELLTKILLFDTGIADESFVDVYVLAKNYWPSKYGGLESYAFAYALMPRLTDLDLIKLANTSTATEKIISLLSKRSEVYVVSAGNAVSHIYVISPNHMS